MVFKCYYCDVSDSWNSFILCLHYVHSSDISLGDSYTIGNIYLSSFQQKKQFVIPSFLEEDICDLLSKVSWLASRGIEEIVMDTKNLCDFYYETPIYDV